LTTTYILEQVDFCQAPSRVGEAEIGEESIEFLLSDPNGFTVPVTVEPVSPAPSIGKSPPLRDPYDEELLTSTAVQDMVRCTGRFILEWECAGFVLQACWVHSSY
jgi:hypothetical protein